MKTIEAIGAGLILEQFGDVPHIGDYFGVWSIYEPAATAIAEHFNSIADLQAHIANPANAAGVRSGNGKSDVLVDDNGVAMFFVSGPMSKSVGSLEAGTSTVRLRQQIRAAARSAEVRAGIVALDTPGGTVKGNRDLADELAKFAESKPLYAFVEDLTASAGVSVASQAKRIYANQASSLYGAMGTYSVIWDQSRRADQLGITVHVIKAGQYKGMGEPGSPVTADQLVELQRTVDSLNESYMELIARGRGLSMDKVRSMADGRIFQAGDAVKMGLIDGVQTFERTYEQLLSELNKPSNRRSSRNEAPADGGPASNTNPISEDNTMAAAAATLAELKATFPNSTADWRESQLEAGASLQDAALSYAAHVEAKAAEEREQHAKKLQDAELKAKAKSAGLGHSPLTTSSVEGDRDYLGDGGDPLEDFNAKVGEQMRRNGANMLDTKARFAAIRAVARRNPELYQSYLLACNPGRKRQRQLQEKFEATASN